MPTKEKMDARTDTPRHLDILGIGEPFATRWRLSLVFGLLVYVGYRPIFGAQPAIEQIAEG
jgi:hypothetical protein